MRTPVALEEDFTKPYRLPYQLGIYLATNAIPDAYAVIDGPDCLFRKAEWVHGKHDLNSTLLDVFGRHRIVSSFVNAEAVIHDRGERLAAMIRQVGQVPGAAAVFTCAMPHVMIIGTQYDKILRSLEAEVPMKLMELPSLSLQGDWLDGYVETLVAIAESINVSDAMPDPNKVAIIGHLMDRNEADQTANVDELRRLLNGLGLDVASIWLSGESFGSLAEARHASTLIAFPYGRRAAKVLADRTGARVVEVDTPFGPGRTQRMLLAVARAVDRVDGVQPFVDAEIRRIVRKLEFAVPHFFVGKRMVFAGAPDLHGGMLQIAAELGMHVELLATSVTTSHMIEDLGSAFGQLPPILRAPTLRPLAAQLDAIAARGPVDLMIADGHFLSLVGPRFPTMEFGFPCHYDHALFDRPFLGFRGWLCFLDRMAQVLARPERRLERSISAGSR